MAQNQGYNAISNVVVKSGVGYIVLLCSSQRFNADLASGGLTATDVVD